MGEEFVGELNTWPVRARTPLTRERIIEATEETPGSDQAERAQRIHERMRSRSRLYAQQLVDIAAFFHADPAAGGCLDDADVSAMKIAVGLRVTTHRAAGLVHDAHRAVAEMPLTVEHLATGDLPEEWHQHLMRQVRRLAEKQVREVDAHVATWDLASISRAMFVRHLGHLIALVTAGDAPEPPAALRRVELFDTDPERGTATLAVTGPIPEITDLAQRLDAAARAVQQAQRAALQDESAGPIPFDIDGVLQETGRPLSLAALRYAILTRSVLPTGGVEVPTSRFRICVTVPALTLLGASDAPGMLGGLTPIPADQARMLAAGEPTWHRILTDPVTGAHLPVAATGYRPTAAMLEQLRLRNPVCAAPGCTRSTVLASEADHILEYDHADPAAGGPTTLENLHLLCWRHHQLKTAGRIDPVRDGPVTSGRTRDDADLRGPLRLGPGRTHWAIGGDIECITRDDTDLATPLLVAALNRAWEEHRAHGETIRRLRVEALTRPRAERAAEERRDLYRAFRARSSRSRAPAEPYPDPGPPPF